MKTMKVMKSVSALFILISLGIFSCSKDDSSAPAPAPLVTTTVSDLVADTILGIAASGQPFGSGKYTFFSLEKNCNCCLF